MDAQTTSVPGQVSINGRLYMTDAKGAHVPVDAVKPERRLEDEVVRKVLGYAEPLAAEVARFRDHTFDDVDAFAELMAQQYSSRGGKKGNITLTSYDGTCRVQVSVADLIEFGPSLHEAKALIDECLTDWIGQSNAPDGLVVVVNGAFDVGRSGKLNHARLLGLKQYEIADPRWKRAMEAIADSVRRMGSKRYVNLYRRDDALSPWRHVSINTAAA